MLNYPVVQGEQLNWAHFIAGQAGVVPLSQAVPGVAKSESHECLANALGVPFLPIMLSQQLPEDLGGFPVVAEHEFGKGEERRSTKVMDKVLDSRIIQAYMEPVVMLIDEMGSVGHTMQAAALQLMCKGIPGSLVFSCGNDIESAAAGVELTPPMVNRLCLLEWEFDTNAWHKGMMHKCSFPSPEIPKLPSDWMEYFPKWGSLVSSYIQAFPDHLTIFPKDTTKQGQPFPTPRQWTNFARCAAATEASGGNKLTLQKLLAGLVGNDPEVEKGVASSFMTWLANQDMPDPEEILANPGKVKLPVRGDMAHAMISSVKNAILRDRTPERWEAGMDFIVAIWGQREELAMAAKGTFTRICPDGYTPKNRTGAYVELQKAMQQRLN